MVVHASTFCAIALRRRRDQVLAHHDRCGAIMMRLDSASGKERSPVARGGAGVAVDRSSVDRIKGVQKRSKAFSAAFRFENMVSILNLAWI